VWCLSKVTQVTILGFARVLLSNQGWVRSLWFLHTIVAIAWWASNIHHPQVTQFLSLQQKNLAKRVRGRRACWSSFRNFCLSWGSATKKNCQIHHSLWTLLEWKLLVVIEKEQKQKHYTHKEGSKEGSLYSCVFHTWDLNFLTFLLLFVKVPHAKHLKIS
jgi:hypothetical protein